MPGFRTVVWMYHYAKKKKIKRMYLGVKNLYKEHSKMYGKGIKNYFIKINLLSYITCGDFYFNFFPFKYDILRNLRQ
jgi:hypothetical protein